MPQVLVPRGTTGLYHLALVVPSKRELARAIGRLVQMRVPNSPTDHTMTKSDYLWDPDGNGIEIYCESPEDGTFSYDSGTFAAIDNQGRARSGRDPIDLPVLFAELQPDDRLDAPLPNPTHMGHVHLHVRDLDEALHFYHELIGFDVMVDAQDRGGLHLRRRLSPPPRSTLRRQGAPPRPAERPPGSSISRSSCLLPPDLDQVLVRLRAGGVEIAEIDGAFEVVDPSANRARLAGPGAAATSTGIPWRTALPESGSITVSSARMLLFTPGCAAATLWRMPGRSWPQPWGRLTTPGITTSVTSTVATNLPTRDSTSACAPSTMSRSRASSGWIWRVQRSFPVISIGTLCIQLLLERRWRRPTSTRPFSVSSSRDRRRLTSSTNGAAASSTLPLAVSRLVGIRGCRGPEVDAVRVGLELGQRETVRVGAKPVAVGGRAQGDVEELLVDGVALHH